MVIGLRSLTGGAATAQGSVRGLQRKAAHKTPLHRFLAQFPLHASCGGRLRRLRAFDLGSFHFPTYKKRLPRLQGAISFVPTAPGTQKALSILKFVSF